MLAIGLDIGTTSVCGVLYDTKSGKQLKSVTEKNDTFIADDEPFKKLQNAAALVLKLTDICERLENEAGGAVESIGVTGQMHGIVYLDAEGTPVSPLAIWQDGRGDMPYKDGKTYAEYLSELTGYPLATGYGSVTYFYDTVNGLVPENAKCFCTIHDLAAMSLAGEKKPLLHTSDAASLGLFDIKKGCFDKAAIERAGLDFSKYPAVADGFKCVGMRGNTPVSVAIGDNQASVIGSVAEIDKSLLINVGTGSQISCASPSVPQNTNLDCRPLMENDYILAGSSLCGGRAYAMLEKFFREVAELVSGEKISSAYPAMDKLMAAADEQKEPLTVDTTFCGTRSNPSLRGAITGLGADNFTVAAFCDGFMSGIAAELHGMYGEIRPLLEKEPTVMIGSGNGLRTNPVLCRKFEQAFGLTLKIPAHKEEAAFGAMLYGLVAGGKIATLPEAQKLIKYI